MMRAMELVLRVARPTDQLDAVAAMYRDGLGFETLASFTDHEGFDGVILGRPGGAYHLELTHHRGHRVGRAPTQDHLLVLYVPDEAEHAARCERMRRAGFVEVASYNPYWDRAGRTFEDLDGYRVVLQRAAWR
jgi:catechol 2,3-dioxygenase-like lactoylglutathione lyase family enzyme